MTGQGRFITLEGGEGGGKTTQLRILAEALRGVGHAVVETREPGGAPAAERIRAILVEGGTDSIDSVTEALLHFAARREHLLATVLPALERGDWVVCDRFIDSTLAYQGYGHGVDRGLLDALAEAVAGDLRPDLTLILDLPVAEGLGRASGRGGAEDRYERMETGFHERLRAGFLDIAAREPERCVVIDAGQPPDKVAGAMIAAVADRLPDSGLARST